jgi:AAA domain
VISFIEEGLATVPQSQVVDRIGAIAPPPKAVLWFELTRNNLENDDGELIRHRFLCRGGGALLVGQTGIGKSSFARQMALHFALGKPFVGLEPARPLKSLIVQAENDDRDEAEICFGVVEGSGLTDQEVQAAETMIYHHREQVKTGGVFIEQVLKPLLEDSRPDLLWIDPQLAYLGGDQNDQTVVGQFLRNGLNPLLEEYQCAAILVHHTAKPSQNKRKDMRSGDFSYAGSGSAEFANWARAILSLISTGEPGVYELYAAKRGRRLKWKMPDNVTPDLSKIVCHSTRDDQICWTEATADTAAAAQANKNGGKPIPTVEQLCSLFPAFENGKKPREYLLTAGEIRNLFASRGWKRDSYAGVCDQALRERVIDFDLGGRGNRQKLYGRPEVLRAYREQKAQGGTT